MSESKSAFSLIWLTTTYQAMAMAATHHVLTSGVRKRGAMCAKCAGSACLRAMDSAVRDAGMIVVCVDASADVETASRTTQSQPPITSPASSAKMYSSSSALSVR